MLERALRKKQRREGVLYWVGGVNVGWARQKTHTGALRLTERTDKARVTR